MSIISTKPEISSIQPDSTHRTALVGGGYMIAHFSSNDLAPYIIHDGAKHMTLASQFRFAEHVHQSSLSSRSKQSAEVFCKMPLNILVSQLPIKIQKNIWQTKQHLIYIPARTTKANRVPFFVWSQRWHLCCDTYLSALVPEQSAAEEMCVHHATNSNEDKKFKNAQRMRQKRQEDKSKNEHRSKNKHKLVDANLFPPEPPSDNLSEKIARKFCEAISPPSVEEAGRAVLWPTWAEIKTSFLRRGQM